MHANIPYKPKCLLYKHAHKHVYLIEKALGLVSSLIGPILTNSKNNRNNSTYNMLQELKSWYNIWTCAQMYEVGDGWPVELDNLSPP